MRISDRVIEEANYMLKTKKTIRELAKVFKKSKSTIHNDLRIRLKNINIEKYNQVDKVLNYHADTKHIKGGESTKKKYLKD